MNTEIIIKKDGGSYVAMQNIGFDFFYSPGEKHEMEETDIEDEYYVELDFCTYNFAFALTVGVFYRANENIGWIEIVEIDTYPRNQEEFDFFHHILATFLEGVVVKFVD